MPSCSTASRTRRTPASASRPIKKAETDRTVVKASRDRVAEAAKRRKSVQDSLKELDEKQKGQGPQHQEAAAEGADPAGRHDDRSSGSTSIPSSAALCWRVLAYRPAVRRCWSLPGVLVAGSAAACRAGSSPSGARVASRHSSNEFPNALDIIVRAVKSGLPLERRHPADRQRSARAGQDRIPPHRRSPAARPVRFPRPRCA